MCITYNMLYNDLKWILQKIYSFISLKKGKIMKAYE